jgi:hypothetical protein
MAGLREGRPVLTALQSDSAADCGCLRVFAGVCGCLRRIFLRRLRGAWRQAAAAAASRQSFYRQVPVVVTTRDMLTTFVLLAAAAQAPDKSLFTFTNMVDIEGKPASLAPYVAASTATTFTNLVDLSGGSPRAHTRRRRRRYKGNVSLVINVASF